MYSLLHHLDWKRVVAKEAPALGISLLIAELFFKFHSFTVECVAFLATWYALSRLFSLVASANSTHAHRNR